MLISALRSNVAKYRHFKAISLFSLNKVLTLGVNLSKLFNNFVVVLGLGPSSNVKAITIIAYL